MCTYRFSAFERGVQYVRDLNANTALEAFAEVRDYIVWPADLQSELDALATGQRALVTPRGFRGGAYIERLR